MNDLIKIWEGDKLTKEQGFEVSGVKNVKWLQDFELAIQYMAFDADTFYLGHNEHKKTVTAEMNTQQDRMIAWCKEKYPLHNYKRAAKITRELRQIKSEEEIDLMQSVYGMQKKDLVAKHMKLEAGQADLFWQIYDEYEVAQDLFPI